MLVIIQYSVLVVRRMNEEYVHECNTRMKNMCWLVIFRSNITQHIGGFSMQLPRPSHLTHLPLTDIRAGYYIGVEFDTVSHLDYCKCCSARSSSWQYSQASTRAELCCMGCPTSDEMVAHSATPQATALAPGLAVNRLQTCRPDVQDSRIYTNLLQPLHHTSRNLMLSLFSTLPLVYCAVH